MAVKHVLLTGATGFLGSNVLAHILETTDWNTTVVVSSRHHRRDRVRQVVDAIPGALGRYRVVTHDLSCSWPSELVHLIRSTRFGPIDVIINVASVANVDQSIADPRSVVTANVALMTEMLELARAVKPTAFIHVSTGEVYGPVSPGQASREWGPINPPNSYSASKAAQEAIAVAYWRSYGVPVVIANCQNVFGERQQPQRFVPKTIAKILAGEPVSIYATNRVPSRRTFMHARNVADALCFLAAIKPTAVHEFPAQYVLPDRYNVTGEIETDNDAVARAIAQYVRNHTGRDVQHEHEYIDTSTLRPGHDARYALDGTKLAKLGWMAPVPMWTSLDQTVRWTLEHPEWLA